MVISLVPASLPPTSIRYANRPILGCSAFAPEGTEWFVNPLTDKVSNATDRKTHCMKGDSRGCHDIFSSFCYEFIKKQFRRTQVLRPPDVAPALIHCQCSFGPLFQARRTYSGTRVP